MSRKTHSHKRTHAKRSPKRKPSRPSKRSYDWRTKILAGAIAFALLAGGTFAHWRANNDEVLIAKNIPSPVKNIPTISTASASELSDIPPEALHPQPPIAVGYNAHSGGLPPGALPPGVSLPGLSLTGMSPTEIPPAGMSVGMVQGGRTTAQGYGVYDGIRQQFTGKERDTETGLDYFGARYYSSTQGRFTSVDPENAGADPSNPQSWNGYAYALNNPLRYQDPDGREVRVCDTQGNCANISDQDAKNGLFNKQYQQSIGGVVKDNKIYQNGELIGTYQRISFDDLNDNANALIDHMAARAPAIKQAIGAFAVASVVGGTGGGLLYYAATPLLAPTVTTLALRTAPLLPAVPSAIDKLRNLGISLEQANAIVQSPTSQKLIDKANGGNINVIQEISGKLMRITLDPTGQRIISAGIVRANQITNGIANGRFVKK